MPLSIQGNAVLFKMFDSFRIAYVEAHPGDNMNDVERAFLCAILGGLVYNSNYAFAPFSDELKETEDVIEAIR